MCNLTSRNRNIASVTQFPATQDCSGTALIWRQGSPFNFTYEKSKVRRTTAYGHCTAVYRSVWAAHTNPIRDWYGQYGQYISVCRLPYCVSTVRYVPYR